MKSLLITDNLSSVHDECDSLKIEVCFDLVAIHSDSQDLDKGDRPFYIQAELIEKDPANNDQLFFATIGIDDLELFAHSILKQIEMARRDYGPIIAKRKKMFRGYRII